MTSVYLHVSQVGRQTFLVQTSETPSGFSTYVGAFYLDQVAWLIAHSDNIAAVIMH